MVGTVAFGAGKVKKSLSPASYDRVMALLSSMVKRAVPQIARLNRSAFSWKNVASADDVIIGGAVKRMTVHDSGARFTREFVVKFKLVEQMRKRLGISTLVSGQGAAGTESIASYSTDELGNAGENWGRGVSEGRMDHASVEALTISGHVESGRFSALAVELTIRDALAEGDVIVYERMVVE